MARFPCPKSYYLYSHINGQEKWLAGLVFEGFKKNFRCQWEALPTPPPPPPYLKYWAGGGGGGGGGGHVPPLVQFLCALLSLERYYIQRLCPKWWHRTAADPFMPDQVATLTISSYLPPDNIYCTVFNHFGLNQTVKIA